MMKVTIEDILGLIKTNEEEKKETIKIKLKRLGDKELEFKKIDYTDFLELVKVKKNGDELLILNHCIVPDLKDPVLQKEMFEPTDIVNKAFTPSEIKEIVNILCEQSGIGQKGVVTLVDKAVSDIKN